jgi:isoquinoline 1-oxidoreductase beta subunit
MPQDCGLGPQQVSIHTLYAGGSFGRRANPGSDYIVEAVSIAKAYGADGTPIKLQWTREDDIHGGLYRPMYFHKLEAGLNDKVSSPGGGTSSSASRSWRAL